MVFHLRTWIKRAKYIIIFIILTYLIAMLLHRISLWVEPEHRYDQPLGEAVKVTIQNDTSSHESSLKDRLLFFYWYGE